MSRTKLNVRIDLHKLGHRIILMKKGFVSVDEIAYELGVALNTAGKILAALARLGYVEKWSNRTYRICKNIKKSFTY